MVDVYLISGFLGSGKTTLLKRLLMQIKEAGLKPAVLMNEMGALNVDSEQVKGDVPLKEILDGCICCTGSEKSEAQIQGLLAGPEFDVLLIETTGAAHPVEALDAVFSPLFAERLHFKGIVTVADSKRWTARNELSPQIRSLFLEQIRHGDLLLANKTDLLSDSEQSQTIYEMQSLNPKGKIVQTVQSKIPFAELQKLAAAKPVAGTAAPLSRLNLKAEVIALDEPIKRERFEEWVQSLPDSVYRIKGYVPLEGSKYPHAFQYAYGMVQWLPEYMKMRPQIVVIGEQLEGVGRP